MSCPRSHSQEQKRRVFRSQGRALCCHAVDRLSLPCQTWAGSVGLWPSWDLGKGDLKAFPWNRDLGASVMKAVALSASVCSVSGFVLAKREGQTRSYQTPEE